MWHIYTKQNVLFRRSLLDNFFFSWPKKKQRWRSAVTMPWFTPVWFQHTVLKTSWLSFPPERRNKANLIHVETPATLPYFNKGQSRKNLTYGFCIKRSQMLPLSIAVWNVTSNSVRYSNSKHTAPCPLRAPLPLGSRSVYIESISLLPSYCGKVTFNNKKALDWL